MHHYNLHYQSHQFLDSIYRDISNVCISVFNCREMFLRICRIGFSVANSLYDIFVAYESPPSNSNFGVRLDFQLSRKLLHFNSASESTGRALALLARRMMCRLKLFLLVTCTPLTMSPVIIIFQVLGMHHQKLSQRWSLESHARVFLLHPDQQSLWRRRALQQRLL